MAGIIARYSVNHSMFFKDPVTGVHTENIENYWNRVKTKTKYKRMNSVHHHQPPNYGKFMWFGLHTREIGNICRGIARILCK